MIVQLLTEHHLEFLSFKGGCTGSSESTLVKMLHCWKSHATAQIFFFCTMTHTFHLLTTISRSFKLYDTVTQMLHFIALLLLYMLFMV